MGLPRLFKRRDIAQADVIDVGRPLVAPADNIAPTLALELQYGLTNPLAYMAMGGCLSREVALSVPAVRRGVRVITTAIAQMPLVRRRGFELLPSGGYLEQPEANRPYVTTMTLTVEDLIFYPYAWWKVESRDDQGFPRTVVRLEPEYVSVQNDTTSGEVTAAYVTYRNKLVDKRDLIRFDGPDEGILRLGIIEIMTALRLELAAQLYANPEIPTGYWKYSGQLPLKDTDIDNFMATFRASRANGASAFAKGNVDWVNVLSMPDQLQLVQGREEASAQIARMLNLPPRYANAKSGDSMTYSTIATEHRDLYDMTLQSYMGPIAQRLSMYDTNGTPRGQRIEFDADKFLRSEPRERAEIGEILIRSGQSTAAEQRAEQGKPPLEETAGI